MLTYLCLVRDDRWRHNVVRSKKWQTRHSHIVTSSVFPYLLYIMKKQKIANGHIIYVCPPKDYKNEPIKINAAVIQLIM